MGKGKGTLLNQVSQRLGIDLRYFLKGGFWTSVSQGTNIVKGLILSYAFANWLPKETYGQYTFLISLIGITAIFALPGMGTALIQSLAKGFDGNYFLALKKVFKYSFLGSLFLLVASIYYYTVGNTTFSLIILIFAAIYPLYPTSAYNYSFFSGKKMFSTRAFITFIFNLCSIATLLLILLLSPSLYWLTLGTVAVQILVQGYFSTFYAKKFIQNKKQNKKDLDYGKRLTFVSVLSSILKRSDQMIIPIILGFELLASYTVALVIPTTLLNFIQAAAITALPKLVKNRLTKRHIFLILGGSTLFTLFTLLFIWLIFPILYPLYLDSLPYALLLCVNLLLVPLFTILFFGLSGKEDVTSLNQNTLLFGITNITLTILLGLAFGLYGVVFARILSNLVRITHGIKRYF